MLHLAINQAFIKFPSQAELSDCGADMAEIIEAGASADASAAGPLPLLDADLDDRPFFITDADLVPLPAPEEHDITYTDMVPLPAPEEQGEAMGVLVPPLAPGGASSEGGAPPGCAALEQSAKSEDATHAAGVDDVLPLPATGGGGAPSDCSGSAPKEL